MSARLLLGVAACLVLSACGDGPAGSIAVDLPRSADGSEAAAVAPPIPRGEQVPTPFDNDPDRFWMAPPAEVVAGLLPRAEAGDDEAAYILGSRLTGCARTLAGPGPRQRQRDYERELEEDDPGNLPADLLQARREATTRRHEDALRRYEECAAVDDAHLAAGVAWLERAGRKGHAGARLAYATSALSDFESRGKLIANLEEARRRRPLARAWLEEALAAGNEQALNQYLRELGGGSGLYAPDPEALIAYGYAQSLIYARRRDAFSRRDRAGAAGDSFEALWRDGPERYGDFTDARWQALVEQGREIYRRDFAQAWDVSRR